MQKKKRKIIISFTKEDVTTASHTTPPPHPLAGVRAVGPLMWPTHPAATCTGVRLKITQYLGCCAALSLPVNLTQRLTFCSVLVMCQQDVQHPLPDSALSKALPSNNTLTHTFRKTHRLKFLQSFKKQNRKHRLESLRWKTVPAHGCDDVCKPSAPSAQGVVQ